MDGWTAGCIHRCCPPPARGDPAIVQIPLGKGSVIVFTTSWRPSDSQLALSSKFVPLLGAILEQSSNQPVPKAQYFDGFAADAISPERVARWADPAGGYFHAMHPSLWGDFTWRITGHYRYFQLDNIVDSTVVNERR